MLGYLVLISVPPFVAALGSLFARRGGKAVFCTVVGAVTFFVTGIGGLTGAGLSGAEGAALGDMYLLAGSTPFDALGTLGAPPAYMLLMKLCVCITDDVSIFVMILAAIRSLLSGVLVYRRCSTPYAGAMMFVSCFMLTSFAGQAFGTAAVICALSSEYIEERRFFRFVCIVLAAACFDSSALLMIPAYFITLIPKVFISAGVSAALAAGAVFAGGITDSIFVTLGTGRLEGICTPVLCAVFAAAGAVMCALMTPMIKNRNSRFIPFIHLMCCGAAFAAAGAADSRLFPLSVFLLMPAAVTLSPEVHAITRRFAEIVFPEKKEQAGTAVTIFFSAVLFGIYAYTVFSGCYGSEFFGRVLFGESGIL